MNLKEGREEEKQLKEMKEEIRGTEKTIMNRKARDWRKENEEKIFSIAKNF